jgi:enoyl-CoA hydratase/carnithine racemase
MAGSVELSKDGAVATLVVNNIAKRNALDIDVAQSLEQTANAVSSDPSINVVIIRGAGDQAFSAGADFDALTASDDIAASYQAVEAALMKAFAALENIDAITIAAIRGACFGAGVQLSLTPDIRIASDNARFCIPAVGLGIMYPLNAIRRITEQAGIGQAISLLAGGEPYDAEEARKRRLIDEIVPDAEFDERINSFAAKIAGYPPEVVQAYKRIVHMFATEAPIGDIEAVALGATEGGEYVRRLTALAEKRREKAAQR